MSAFFSKTYFETRLYDWCLFGVAPELAPLVLGQTTPYAEALFALKGFAEAIGPDGALGANGLGVLHGHAPFREKKVGVHLGAERIGLPRIGIKGLPGKEREDDIAMHDSFPRFLF